MGGDPEKTLWMVPLSFFVNAGFSELFGFHLYILRAVGVAWGLLYLVAQFWVARALNLTVRAALFGVLVSGTASFFIRSAADVRMDVMMQTLALLAVAVYLSCRDRNQTLAWAGSHALVVAAG